jgi:uncharacterized BrkB/YihY/UPF0761 family membrane protein
LAVIFQKMNVPQWLLHLRAPSFFAMPSLLLIVIFIPGVFLGPEAASGEIQARLSGSIGSQTAGQIQTMVSGVATNRTGGIIATTTSERP